MSSDDRSVQALESRVLLASTGGGLIELGLGSAVAPAATAVDRAGNFYVAGTFNGAVDFNPRRNQMHVVDGGTLSSFVARYGAAGGLDWVIPMRYEGELNGIPGIGAMATDARGDVYLAGGFSGRPTFDARTGVWTAPKPTPDGPLSTLWKFRRDGTFAFGNDVERVANHLRSAGHVAVDDRGNIYLTVNDVDFTNGTDHFETRSFVEKFTPSGRWMWSTGVAGAYPHVLAMDRHQHPWVVSTLQPLGGPDVVLATKYNGRGRFLDDVPIATGGTGLLGPAGLAFDREDNLVVAGGFTGTWDFDAGPGERLLGPKRAGSGYSNAFLTKLTPDHRVVFAQTIGGSLNDTISGVSVDRRGVIRVAGSFGDVVDFDPSAAGQFLLEGRDPAPGSAQDLFTAAYDGAGRFLSAGSLTRAATLETATAVAFTSGGSAIVLGQSIRGTDERSIVIWRPELLG